MRRLLVSGAAIALAAAAVVGAAYLLSEPAASVNPGDAAPDLVMKDLNGTPGRGIPRLGHAPVLLVFFDSRWPSSADWLHGAETLHRRFALDGLAVIGVALDADASATQRLLDETEARFIVYHDPGGAVSGPAYGSLQAPQAWLIDARGRVLKVVREWQFLLDPQTKRLLSGLMPSPAPTPHR
jgi:peroxiredoxin